MKKPVVLDPRAAKLWSGWAILTLIAEFVFRPAWIVAALGFAFLEGKGVESKKQGDTWSEFIVKFLEGGLARYPLIIGWIGWIAMRLIQFGDGPTFHHFGIEMGRLCLVGGLVLWLSVHLFGKLKYG